MIRQSDSAPSAATDLHLLLTQLTELRRAMEQSVEFGDGLDRSPCTALRGRMRDCDAQLARVLGRLEHNLRQRESVESALHESEHRYRSLYDNNPSMYFTLSPDGLILSVNHYGAEQLGYQPDELIGRSVLAVFNAEDHEIVLGQLVLCSTTPFKVFDWEIQKRRKDGSMLWVKERARAIKDHGGRMLVLVVCEDITERRQTEEQVRESEQAIRSLHEATSNPGLSIDQRIHTVLELGCHRFRLPIGLVTNVRGDELELTHVWRPSPTFIPGMRVPLRQSYCGATLEAHGVVSFEHAKASEWSDHPGYQTLGLECYIGTKLQGQGKVHGTISFVDAQPRPTPFSKADKDFLLLMAQWIAAESDRRQAERRLESINECFLASGSDPLANIHRLTALCGEILEGTCALYSRLEGEFLSAVGRWHEPTNFKALDRAEGHLCTDLIRRGTDHLVTVRHLSDTSYAKTDPNVSLYQLQTYIGKVVSFEDEAVGSLCVVFQRDFIPTEADERLMGILASAIGTEEQRIRAQKALRTSELRLQRFVSEAPVGLVILDPQQRLLTANKAFCTLTGYAEDELLGRTYDLYTHPDDLSINLKLTDEYYRGLRKGYTIEKRYIRKTGQVIWVSVNATGIELPNHPGPLLLAAVQDITDQKRATEERERFSQDLHDNILQSLYAVGMQLEASKLASGRSARRAKVHASQAIDQLNRLVSDVRHFIALLNRGGSHKMDLREALRQLVSAFSTTEHRPPELEIKEGVLDLITTEQAEQLLNIAREALSNSVRHAKATHRSVRLSPLGPAGMRMQICDDGIGFVPKLKRKQGHGLVNMAARAKTIGARLRLTSKPDHGTCITVDLSRTESS